MFGPCVVPMLFIDADSCLAVEELAADQHAPESGLA
jgi:hypothetical protein